MTRTMRRDGTPTPARFSAALRALRRAAAVELRELRHMPAMRDALRCVGRVERISGYRRQAPLVTIAVRRCDAPQWALGVLSVAMPCGVSWAPPVAPGARARCRAALVARAMARDASAWAYSCGEQDAMGERSAADFRLADYLAGYCVTEGRQCTR